ncbi:MAG: sugar isomerase domain-containing protein [Phycisphaerales bacterium]|nr:sugar isomerase domain-containing protein [Phycisphaerales bacterium]
MPSSQERGQAYLHNVISKLAAVESTQKDQFQLAGEMMADAYAQDRLIHVYGGGGHTVMMVCEMFFRAGGLANINPIYGHDISPLCQALKYLEIERTTGYGACLIRYYDLKKDDLLIIFHNIGYNPTTIDAAEEAKNRGAKIIAVSSTDWQHKLPRDHHIRHPNKKHLFEYADLVIDDANPYGDADFYVQGFADAAVAPTSTIVDAFVAHRLVIEAVSAMVRRGLEPPIFRSANFPDGDAYNKKLIERYRGRVKDL